MLNADVPAAGERVPLAAAAGGGLSGPRDWARTCARKRVRRAHVLLREQVARRSRSGGARPARRPLLGARSLPAILLLRGSRHSAHSGHLGVSFSQLTHMQCRPHVHSRPMFLCKLPNAYVLVLFTVLFCFVLVHTVWIHTADMPLNLTWTSLDTRHPKSLRPESQRAPQTLTLKCEHFVHRTSSSPSRLDSGSTHTATSWTPVPKGNTVEKLVIYTNWTPMPRSFGAKLLFYCQVLMYLDVRGWSRLWRCSIRSDTRATCSCSGRAPRTASGSKTWTLGFGFSYVSPFDFTVRRVILQEWWLVLFLIFRLRLQRVMAHWLTRSLYCVSILCTLKCAVLNVYTFYCKQYTKNWVKYEFTQFFTQFWAGG